MKAISNEMSSAGWSHRDFPDLETRQQFQVNALPLQCQSISLHPFSGGFELINLDHRAPFVSSPYNSHYSCAGFLPN